LLLGEHGFPAFNAPKKKPEPRLKGFGG